MDYSETIDLLAVFMRFKVFYLFGRIQRNSTANRCLQIPSFRVMVKLKKIFGLQYNYKMFLSEILKAKLQNYLKALF